MTEFPIMGDLPKDRVCPAPPFFVTGVDYAGPILIKNKSGRGAKLIKSYIALSICFTTKCIHLELVGDLSKDAFIGAFRRFTSRRGNPARYSQTTDIILLELSLSFLNWLNFYRQMRQKYKHLLQIQV